LALREHNSGAESGGELFNGSTNAASLLVSTQKSSLVEGCEFFVSDVIK